jgi:diamine N-acetyltransferase
MREGITTAEIRRADSDDAATIALLGRITFGETFGYLFHRHGQDLRAYLDHTFDAVKLGSSLRKPENAYWLALQRGLPIGYAKLKHPSPQPLPKLEACLTAPLELPLAPPPGRAAADAAQLQKIYILREFLGDHIGRALLASVMQDAAARSSLVWLEVLRENRRAIRFYERHGFAPSGEDTYTIGAQSFQFHLMARPLP